MAIIDLASLCSPIHNFKRGFLFSHSDEIKQNGNNDINFSYNNASNTNIAADTNGQYILRKRESFLTYNDTVLNNTKSVVVLENLNQGRGEELGIYNNKLLINNGGTNVGFAKLNYARGLGATMGSAGGMGDGVGGYKFERCDLNNVNDSINKGEANLSDFGTAKAASVDINFLNLGVSGDKLRYFNRFDQVYVNLKSYNNNSSVESYNELALANKDLEPKEEYAHNNTNKKQNSNLMQITKNYGYFCENPVLNVNSCLEGSSNTIVIFDLDDTLIPTDWIRDTYSRIRQSSSLNYLFSNSNNNVYQYIRMQIDQQVNHQLIPNVIKMLTISKKQFLDTAIVTNARSIGWIKVIEAMFPELTAALNELNIPVIRTSPQGAEPEIEDGEKYFNYWMIAKKNEFEKIIDKWLSQNKNKNFISHNLSRVNLISVGDNDFEECAAVHLAVVDRKVEFSKIIRCTPGLSPKMFLNQLQTISNVIEIEKKRNSSHPWINYTNTVSARIIENGQFLSGYGSYGVSTEDE
ncbi:membrane associated protein with a signal peptide [Cryptosporidium ryanae]|uniref:membrane associated protein with a signal peptide n=1 Tax=Cryptosporidium ryanae TaxID=515981 RepID=UPI003519E5E4|nr:membrane associated protein with a signal peptide [Cryptosporidium ryanae]